MLGNQIQYHNPYLWCTKKKLINYKLCSQNPYLCTVQAGCDDLTNDGRNGRHEEELWFDSLVTTLGAGWTPTPLTRTTHKERPTKTPRGPLPTWFYTTVHFNRKPLPVSGHFPLPRYVH